MPEGHGLPLSPGSARLVGACRASALMLLVAVSAAKAATAAESGVRHQLRASLSLDPASPFAKAEKAEFRAELRAVFRISDHAPDADFFGAMVADFLLTHPDRPADEQVVWQDSKCHRDRGLPKISLIEIQGTISVNGTDHPVSAALRRIGKRLGADEITIQKLVPTILRGEMAGLASRATTRGSGLVIDADLSSLRCSLDQR